MPWGLLPSHTWWKEPVPSSSYHLRRICRTASWEALPGPLCLHCSGLVPFHFLTGRTALIWG